MISSELCFVERRKAREHPCDRVVEFLFMDIGVGRFGTVTCILSSWAALGNGSALTPSNSFAIIVAEDTAAELHTAELLSNAPVGHVQFPPTGVSCCSTSH